MRKQTRLGIITFLLLLTPWLHSTSSKEVEKTLFDISVLQYLQRFFLDENSPEELIHELEVGYLPNRDVYNFSKSGYWTPNVFSETEHPDNPARWLDEWEQFLGKKDALIGKLQHSKKKFDDLSLNRSYEPILKKKCSQFVANYVSLLEILSNARENYRMNRRQGADKMAYLDKYKIIVSVIFFEHIVTLIELNIEAFDSEFIASPEGIHHSLLACPWAGRNGVLKLSQETLLQSKRYIKEIFGSLSIENWEERYKDDLSLMPNKATINRRLGVLSELATLGSVVFFPVLTVATYGAAKILDYYTSDMGDEHITEVEQANKILKSFISDQKGYPDFYYPQFMKSIVSNYFENLPKVIEKADLYSEKYEKGIEKLGSVEAFEDYILDRIANKKAKLQSLSN